MPDDVKPFLKKELQAILNDKVKQEAIEANLFYEGRDIRFQKMITNLKKIADGI